MIIHGQQQGLLVIGRPPLVDGGIVLPEFAQAGAFPAAAGFGAWFGLAEEVGKVVSGKGSHRLAVTLETEAGFQFVGDELEVGRLLEGEKLLEEGADFRRPVRPMVAPGEFGGERRPFLEEAGAEPIKVGAADLQVVAGISGVDQAFIELPEDLLEKQVGEAFCDLLFYSLQSIPPLSLGRGLSSAFATLRPPQPLDPGTDTIGKSTVSF